MESRKVILGRGGLPPRRVKVEHRGKETREGQDCWQEGVSTEIMTGWGWGWGGTKEEG